MSRAGRAEHAPSLPALCLSLLGVQLLAVAMRSITFPEVFPGDGSVDLDILDSAYHARLALYAFVNFPSVLDFDPYIAFPDGAPVPLPPLFDWTLAAVAHLFGHDPATFERVAAFASPVLGALGVLPVYALGRMLAGHGVGLGAGALFAVLPAITDSSRIGNIDHHAWVTTLAVTHLALIATLAARDATPRTLAWASAGLLFTRAGLALSWSGSLLYLGLGDATILLVGLLLGRRAVLAGQALGAGLAAALLVPWLATSATPLGGVLSTTTLSWIHVLALLGIAFVSGVLVLLHGSGSQAGVGQRLALAAVLCCGGLGVLLVALPDARDALESALPFFARSDGWGHANLEQRPLFRLARDGIDASLAQRRWGWLVYALPFAWLATLARARADRVRGPALCVAGWMAALGPLAILQERFGRDFAPTAAVGLALLFDDLAAPLRRRVPAALADAAAVLLACALLWPALAESEWPHLVRIGSLLRGEVPANAPPRLSARASLVRFAREIRAATPETGGYFDPTRPPEYAILAQPSYGHVLHYFARRPTPANNLGPYLDLAKFRAVRRAYAERSEPEVIAIAESLGARYVLTSYATARKGPGFLKRLHRGDLRDGESSERLRLRIEGPAGGALLGDLRRPPAGVPAYQLYEVVRGALLEVPAPAGSEVHAETTVLTSLGRRLAFRAAARSESDGWARLRVPYADRSQAESRALEPYRIHVGERVFRASVSDADVREGATLRVSDETADPRTSP